MRSGYTFLALSLLLAAPAAAHDPVSIEAAAAAALARDNRAQDAARDQYRHPAETLAFFQVEPDMKVGEYAPGGGWYSRVLGNYLSPKGRLVGLYFTPEEGIFDEKTREGIRQGAAGFAAKVEGWTARPAAGTSALTLDGITDADKGTFDRILVIRMMHNMMRWNFADSELKAMRDLLKPGGMLGIVQHRAPEWADGDYSNGTRGYLRQSDVVGFVEAMGFDLVGASEINANPRDTADYPEGVWEMPPTLRTKRDDLRTLGESDRMTLLFRKR
ncbi:methyltransferase [Tsuneonella sp. YG55]|uniref:Methyltransferase n=1 Tax=Tsuneonella litorea TaxID=2976475 RepID=A0A9X3A873_9SPHN|nr:methyltransferase [Tsuneonella litorea]MCT2557550.1 methyltransferase [Tsuneonella litorea]